MKRILYAVLFPLLFGSCSTDFDTIADYKETVVVYGLLDQLSDSQLIRINKAYLGEGNALIMAQQKDSINYADILNVSMEKLDANGNVLATYSLQRDTSLLKDSGIFNYPFQVNYKLTNSLDINASYRLRVKNTQTGLEAKSTTSILGNINLKTPGANQKMNFTLPANFSVQYSPASGAKIYNLTLRFHYTEVNTVSGKTTKNYIDWFFSDEVVADIYSTSDLKKLIPRSDFYKLLADNIPVDPNVIRHLGDPDIGAPKGYPMEVRITSGSENLYKYMQLTTPSASKVQERPQFSNIENGVGLFTGRSLYSTFRDLDDLTKNSLNTNPYTQDLNFQ